jgi:hypothetical protein
MKNLTIFLFLLCVWGKAQERNPPVQIGVSGEEIIPAKMEFEEVYQELIYPGCESFIEQGNEALKSCFHQKFRKEIHDVLQTYLIYIDDSETTEFHSNLKFVINKEGKIERAEVNAAHPQFKAIVNKSINTIAEKKTGIIPAKNSNGEPINVLFRIPVSLIFSD